VATLASQLGGSSKTLILPIVRRMAERHGARRTNQISLIAFLAGICLLGIGVLASLLNFGPDLFSTVVAIVGVAGMIYGLATGGLVAFSRDYDKQ
jgi:small-conductance mechanosensitive channel